MTDLDDLLKELEDIKAKQKALAEKEALCKADILEAMQEDGIEKEEGPYGTVRIQRRAEKDYGPEVRAMEEELKATKKLKEDLGDYTIMSVKDSLVYTAPKDKELF
jgi:hypothetical protein